MRRQISKRYARRQIEEPARLRELGHPDAIEHHDDEARPAPFEIDHEELALLVRAPRQYLRFHADAGMSGLEFGEQLRNRIHGPEDLGVLEDESNRSSSIL